MSALKVLAEGKGKRVIECLKEAQGKSVSLRTDKFVRNEIEPLLRIPVKMNSNSGGT